MVNFELFPELDTQPVGKGLFQKALSLLITVSLSVAMSWASTSFAHAEGAPFVKLTAAERDWLDQNPEKLTLFFNLEFPPIEFSSSSGAFTGMGADIISLVEKRLGVTFIKTPSIDWNKHLSALESGEYAIAPAIVATPERQRYAFFTAPYATAPMVIITNNLIQGELTFDALAGRRVAVVAGCSIENNVREMAQDRFEAVPVANVAEGLRGVSFGQVDALVENLAVAGYHIDREGIPNLRVAGNTSYTVAWSIGVSRKYPLLYSSIQKALDTIPESEIQAIRKRWIALDVSTWLDPETRRLLQMLNVFVSLLLIGLVVLSFFFRRRLKEQVASLKTAQQALLEQSELLGLATEATQAGVWDFRPVTRTIYLSRQWCAMLGYTSRHKVVPLAEFASFVHPEDQPAVIRSFEDYTTGGGAGRFEAEFRLRRADGAWCWVLSKGSVVERSEKGIPSRVIGLDLNIQNIKEAQEKRAQSEARFRSLFMNAPIPLANVSLEGNTVEVNDSLTHIFGYTHEDLPDLDHWWSLAYPDPDYRSLVLLNLKAAISRAIADNSAVEPAEYRVTCKDGSVLTTIVGANVIGDTLLVSFFDISELREKESALQESMELLRATFNANIDGILAVNKDLRVIQANQKFYKMWHISPELHKTSDDAALREIILDQLEDPAGFQNMLNTLYLSRVQDMFEIPFKDGRVFECHSAPMVIAEEEIGRVWDFRDISERKRSEEALKESEARFRTLFKMAPVPLASLSRDGRILAVNDQLTQTMGYTTDDVPTLEQAWMIALPDPEFRNQVTSQWRADLERALADNSNMESFECPVLCKNGTTLTMVIGTKLIGDNVLVSFFDITERKRAEEALRDSERKLRSIFAAMTDLILILDAEGRCIEVAPTNTAVMNMPPNEALGKTLGDVFPVEKANEFLGAISTALYEKKPVSLDYELAIGARQVWFASTISPLSPDSVIWVAQDITDRKQAEEERQKLQVQLHQSQKLEAVGVLAGGVAHDFNNMLGAIIGYAELTLLKMDSADPFRGNLDRIMDAARRSADLTRQLLAFARKQTIEPTVFDLNESVEALLKMIRRLIGENIELAWLPGIGTYTVKMDPSQFDQILINLCVNAKDAISGVGRITIETDIISFNMAPLEAYADFTPGEYVLLCVSDNGCGMDKETLNHIFEPFFTTKGLGRGTGMGLATVYGIVKQNEGFINVYSETGLGTTFRIYIPLNATASAGEKAPPVEDIPRSRGETILLIEDDPTILEMGTHLLQHLGYSVISANSPNEAIRIVEDNSCEIHLLIIDVVMPEMNGRDLADRLLAIRPKVKHLFMSGYTADVIAHQGVLDEGVSYIQKPFSLNDLASKVREVLG